MDRFMLKEKVQPTFVQLGGKCQRGVCNGVARIIQRSHHHPNEWYQNCWLQERGITDGAVSVDVLAKPATSSLFV
jgi:hypothetical protein